MLQFARRRLLILLLQWLAIVFTLTAHSLLYLAWPIHVVQHNSCCYALLNIFTFDEWNVSGNEAHKGLETLMSARKAYCISKVSQHNRNSNTPCTCNKPGTSTPTVLSQGYGLYRRILTEHLQVVKPGTTHCTTYMTLRHLITLVLPLNVVVKSLHFLAVLLHHSSNHVTDAHHTNHLVLVDYGDVTNTVICTTQTRRWP